MDENRSEVAVSVMFIITTAERVKVKAASQSLKNTRSFCDSVRDLIINEHRACLSC